MEITEVPGYGVQCQHSNNTIEKHGKSFLVNSEYLKTTGIPQMEGFTTLSPETMDDFVFATGASSNHFSESIDAVENVQRLFPNYTILYYDLGLDINQVITVSYHPLISGAIM